MAQRKCNEARQLRSPDEVPVDWAETRLLQGEISEELAKVAGGRPNEKYDDSIEIYSDVLSVMEDAKIPYYRELAEQRLKAAYSQLNGSGEPVDLMKSRWNTVAVFGTTKGVIL
jgi:hypothetical protein